MGIAEVKTLSRADLLRRGAAGSAVLVASSGFPAAAAAGVPDGDLSYLRLLVAAELLKTDFQTRALRSRTLASPAAHLARQLHADDAAHYRGLAALMRGAGQPPTNAGDIDFSYPKRAFESQGSIVRLARRLGTLTLGAYLGAIKNVQTPELRQPLGQIAANEAQQLSALAHLLGRPAIGEAFAAALPIDVVSAALDEYES
jgi:Ferritin-like domain